MAMLYILQLLDGTFGFRVWPIGEDRNWLYFLQQHETYPAQKAFWAVDGRNPFAPWWYLLGRPLIEETAYGIYIVRQLITLLCGLSVYMVVRGIGGHGHERLALYAGTLSLLWAFSENPSQISWTMVLAMSLALFSLAAYTRFLESQRLKWAYLVTSLLLSFAAVGTYTLQSGVAAGVFGLALTWRHAHLPERSWRQRLYTAVSDSAPFVLLFVLFLLIWTTTTRLPLSTMVESPPVLKQVSNVIASTAYIIWHPSTTRLFRSFASLEHSSRLLALCAASLLTVAILFAVRCRRNTAPREASETCSLRTLLARTAVVILAISAPTIALESKSPIWTPGARAYMIRQSIQPILIASILYCAVWFSPVRAALQRRLEVVLFGAVCFASYVTFLSYNHTQVSVTRSSHALALELQVLVPEITRPTTFLVSGIPPGVSAYNSDIFAKTIYRSNDVNLKILVPGGTADGTLFSDVIFGPDEKGVYLESTLGHPTFITRSKFSWIPYESVIAGHFDGVRFRRLTTIAPAQFAGYRVRFDRTTPVVLREPKRELLISDDVRNWPNMGTIISDEGAILFSNDTAGGYDIIQRRIALAAKAVYEVSVEARSGDPAARLFIDLYDGPAYDAVEQNSAVSGFKETFTRHVVTIPAGNDPPPSGFVRLVTVDKGPIYVRSVEVTRIQ